MKNPIRLLPLLLIFVFVSCHDEPAIRTCRISKMLWEGQWHGAAYSPSGRLIRLEAPASKVEFFYNDMDQLEKAFIYDADPDPAYRFEFVHGPFGIVESNEYHPSIWGEYRTRSTFHYSGPTTVDYIIEEEFGVEPAPTFTIRLDFTYSGGNVKSILGSSPEIPTTYTASRYDKKQNPFKALAAAVGNPAFFPVCRMASFPVSTYDISYMSLFSRNNPLRAQYSIPGVDPTQQAFEYAYTGSIAHKIAWHSTSYGVVDTNEYAFDFDCHFGSSSEE